MRTPAGPLFESTFFVSPERTDDFDAWLEELSDEARREPGIVDTRIWQTGIDNEGRAGRICQFRCRDDSAFDELLDSFFADTEASLADAFGDSVDVTRRCLREDNTHDIPPVESPDCLNCGTRLRGQYCGNCGQRARNRLISLWELLSEAFGDLLEFDSRLWRTLIPLLVRPGLLTLDYLQGRRARYMPPFRTYLVLSVIFFVVAFFDPRDDLSLLFEPEPEPTPEEIEAQKQQVEAKKQEILDQVEDSIDIGETISEDHAAEIHEQVAEALEEDDVGINFRIGDEDADGETECNIDDDTLADLPDWFKRRLTPERLERVCKRLEADGGKTFVDLLLDNIPVALIVLLPLMALVLKILYPLSRRYFVEHLLFFIHFHAFFFLILTLQILFARVTSILHVPEPIAILTIVAAAFYIPVYLYMAMRRVYGQGHILTFIKYVGLMVSYTMGATLTLLGAVLFALVSV